MASSKTQEAHDKAVAFLKEKWYSDSQIASWSQKVQSKLDSWASLSSVKSDVKNNTSNYLWLSSKSDSSSWGSSSNINAADVYWDVSWGNKGAWPMDFSNTSWKIDESTLRFWKNAHAEQAKNSSYLTNRNNDIAWYLYSQWMYDADPNVLQGKVWEYLSKFQDFNDAEDWEQANTKRAIADRLRAKAEEESANGDNMDWLNKVWSKEWQELAWKAWYYIDWNGNEVKIYWYDEMDEWTRNLLDRLDDSQKKYVSNLWAKGMQEDLKYYLDTMRSKEQAAARQWINQDLYDINRESSIIQAEQTLRNAEESYNNLKQNWQYLGNLGMPWTSATKIQAIWDAISEAKTQLGEVRRLTQLSLDAQAKQWEGQVLQYNQQIDNLMYDLKWKVWDEITGALSKYTTAELEGQLDTIDGITAFRKELLDDLDKNLSWLTSASLSQMQWINQQYQDIADKMYEYNQNANTVNTEMSAVKGFYVDWNGNPILNNMGQPIEIPPSAPMEPIFDKETGKLIQFALDENWNIVANVQQLWDAWNSDAAMTQYWIISALEQWYDIWDILKAFPNASLKDVQSLAEVVKQKYGADGRSLTWDWTNYSAVSLAQEENWLRSFLQDYWYFKDGKFHYKTWTKWGQCWHFVNNYLQKLGIWRLFTDPITEKTKNINSDEAKIWSVVIMNSESKPQYWHVGIVTNVDPKTWNISILQSNKKWEEEIFTSTKNINDKDILWFFDPTKSINDYNAERQWLAKSDNNTWALSWYKEWYTSDYSNFLKNWTKWFSNWQREDLAKIFWSWENFVSNASAYKTEIDHQVTDTALQMLDNMYDVLSYLEQDKSNIWKLRAWLPYTEGWDMKNKFNQIMSSDALQKLIDLKEAWATFWALSDNELWFITDAANWFSLTSTEDALKKEMIKKMDKILNKSWMTMEQYKARRGIKWTTTNSTSWGTTSWTAEQPTQFSSWRASW